MQNFQREIKDPFASKENIAAFIAEQKEYQQKPYKKPGFRWPHLDMFKKTQETPNADPSRQTIFQQRAIPDGVPLEGHAKHATKYGYRTQTLITIPFEELDKPMARIDRRPNALFISVDDWNDWVGCLGLGQAQTPNRPVK